jgi:DNA-binding LacI/PurR family transcriptional regulator
MPPRTSRRPSMADVARRADVSTQTVSRYFSGHGYVSEETRARISRIVEDLGYVRNRAAGSLRANRTGTIGVLNVGELNWGSAQILSGLAAAARRAGSALMIAEIDPDQGPEAWREDARAAIDHFLAAPVDGIIVSTAMKGSEEVFAVARERVPVVNLSARQRSANPSEALPSSVGYDATRHLLELGHHRIAHLVGPRTRSEALDREAGYLRAMAEAGLEPQVLEGADSWWAPAGAAAADRLAEIDFTAVFAGNDELALGLMSRLEERGLRAPHDYSIVGVDDMPTAAYFSPPLTTVAIDFPRIGELAVEAALQAIETGEHHPIPTTRQPLVVRASTAPLHSGQPVGQTAPTPS